MVKSRKPHSSPRHLNGNVLAAVDVETTGTDPQTNDLIQVCVLPLNGNFEPSSTATPFYLNIKPRFPDNIDWKAMKVNRIQFGELMRFSMECFEAADLFADWFQSLDLPITNAGTKKLCPLWSNGEGFDKGFLVEWLGKDLFNHCFSFHCRDTQSFALEINDRFDFHNEPVPFPKVGLNALAGHFHVENERPHDALSDCLTTAKVYKALMKMQLPNLPRE